MLFVPKMDDIIKRVMRERINEKYRPIITEESNTHSILAKPIIITTRVELCLRVNVLHEEKCLVYNKFIHLIVPLLLHPRHEYVRFSYRKGEEGFYVHSQALLNDSFKTKTTTNSSVTSIKSDKLRKNVILSSQKAKRIRGIHSLIKSVFYPLFDNTEHMKLARKDKTKRDKKKREREKKKSKSGKGIKRKHVENKCAIIVPYRNCVSSSGCQWNQIDMAIMNNRGVGMELGKQVHEQLNLYARDASSYGLSNMRKDPLVKAVIHKIEGEWGLVPLWGEFEIWDGVLNYATSVDMVCLDPNKGRIIFFEIKTGYKHTFEFSQRKVKGGIGIEDSHVGHAMIQLMIPIETMKRRYGIYNICGYVIHVNEVEGVTCYKLPEPDSQKYSTAYTYALNRWKETKQQKKKNNQITASGRRGPLNTFSKKNNRSGNNNGISNNNNNNNNNKRKGKIRRNGDLFVLADKEAKWYSTLPSYYTNTSSVLNSIWYEKMNNYTVQTSDMYTGNISYISSSQKKKRRKISKKKKVTRKKKKVMKKKKKVMKKKKKVTRKKKMSKNVS